MLFYEMQFILPFILFLGIYAISQRKQQNGLILLASYFFYGMWDWRFLGLLIISTLTDFIVGLLMERAQNNKRKALLLTSLIVNLGILGYFKYFNFFIESFMTLFPNLTSGDELLLSIVLPAGISFYTFQTLSYSIDIYKGAIKPERNIVSFAAFVAFFPQLVAGPIERASNLLPQINTDRSVTAKGILLGSRLFLWGCFKKLVVADNLAELVDPIFLAPESYNSITLLIAGYCFALQIYCDFSGYTDMARGLAKMMGFRLSINFNLPYLSQSITEFWRRWHITLSTWFRDYIYIPLGGNRDGKYRTIRNSLITFLVSGIWHGAGWTFILWGACHGALVSIELLLRGSRFHITLSKIPRFIRIIITFNIVTFLWILFRSPDLNLFYRYIRSMYNNIPSFNIIFSGNTWSDVFYAFLEQASAIGVNNAILLFVFSWLLIIVELCQFKFNDHHFDLKINFFLRNLLYSFAIIGLILFASENGQAFIYFQF